MLQEISVSYLSILGGFFGEQSLLQWLHGRLAQRPVIDAQIPISVCIQKKKSPKGLNRACVGAVVFLLAAVGGGSLRLDNNVKRKWVSGMFW